MPGNVSAHAHFPVPALDLAGKVSRAGFRVLFGLASFSTRALATRAVLFLEVLLSEVFFSTRAFSGTCLSDARRKNVKSIFIERVESVGIPRHLACVFAPPLRAHARAPPPTAADGPADA